MKNRAFLRALAALLLAGAAFGPACAGDAPVRPVLLQAAPVIIDSGLLEHLLRRFGEKSAVKVHAVAASTAEAVARAKLGDADLLLVDDTDALASFATAGRDRQAVLEVDLVLVGPMSDPALISGVDDVVYGLRRIASTHSPFVSPDQGSGVRASEALLWPKTGVPQDEMSEGWYRLIAGGPEEAIQAATEMSGYALVDKASWASFRRKHRFEVAIEPRKPLSRKIAVVLVDPADPPLPEAARARAFADFLLSPIGQGAIAGFEIGNSRPFRPGAAPASAPAEPAPAPVAAVEASQPATAARPAPAAPPPPSLAVTSTSAGAGLMPPPAPASATVSPAAPEPEAEKKAVSVSPPPAAPPAMPEATPAPAPVAVEKAVSVSPPPAASPTPDAAPVAPAPAAAPAPGASAPAGLPIGSTSLLTEDGPEEDGTAVFGTITPPPPAALAVGPIDPPPPSGPDLREREAGTLAE